MSLPLAGVNATFRWLFRPKYYTFICYFGEEQAIKFKTISASNPYMARDIIKKDPIFGDKTYGYPDTSNTIFDPFVIPTNNAALLFYGYLLTKGVSSISKVYNSDKQSN